MSNEITVEELSAAIDATKETVKQDSDTVRLKIGEEWADYAIVNKVKSDWLNQLNAMAITPVVDGEPDYQNVAVVFAGTNSWPVDEGQPGYLTAFDALRGEVSGEYYLAEKFLKDTQETVTQRGGKITDVAGFSQAGGYIPRLTAVYGEEYGFHGTGFDDWGSFQSLRIPIDKLFWLQQNPDRLTLYRNDTWAGIPLRDNLVGTIITTNVDTHSTLAKYFEGDYLNLDRLAKDGFFAPGMTEEQVRKAARQWIRDHPDVFRSYSTDEKWIEARVQAYLTEYGAFGRGKSSRGGSAKTVSLDTTFMLSGPDLINQVITQLRTIQARNDAIPEQLRTAHKTALDVSVAAFSMLTTQYDIEAEVHRRGDLPENHMNVGEIERVHTEIENEIAELEQLKSVLTQVVQAREERDRVDAASFGF